MMILLWFVMRRIGSNYLSTVDAISERAILNKNDASALDQFRSQLRARREPELFISMSAISGAIILWLMMFKPF
jgi:hypothetical protein